MLCCDYFFYYYFKSRDNEWFKFITHSPGQIFRAPLSRKLGTNIGLLVLQATAGPVLVHLGIAGPEKATFAITMLIFKIISKILKNGSILHTTSVMFSFSLPPIEYSIASLFYVIF